MLLPLHHYRRVRAFSLVEVVLALAIAAFAVVGLVGLLGTGLRSTKDSADQIQAADFASMLISTRRAAPTATTNALNNFAIPASALSGQYGGSGSSGMNYVAFNGSITNEADAAYQVNYTAGTNALTGPITTQIYLKLTWPPNAPVNTATKHYEVFTSIPLQ